MNLRMNLWMNRLINKSTVIYTSFAFRESINTGKLMVNVSVCSTISVVASVCTECDGACAHHLQTVNAIDIKSHTKSSSLRAWFRRQFALHRKQGDVLPLRASCLVRRRASVRTHASLHSRQHRQELCSQRLARAPHFVSASVLNE